MNTSTVNFKLLRLCLLFAFFPILLFSRPIEPSSFPVFNCPIDDLVINCSNDINTLVADWINNSATTFQQSFPNGSTEYTITNDYAGIPPNAVCNFNDGGLQVTFTATNSIGETQICRADIIILDDEVVIPTCPTTDLVINCTDDIEGAITAWLSIQNSLVATAATNSEGCDGIGQITVTNDYNNAPPSAVCSQTDGGLLVTFTATDECGNSAFCTATIFIIDDEVLINECPTTDLILSTSDDIDAVISQWLIQSENVLKSAATNSDGCDEIGQITVENDYVSRPTLGCQVINNSGRLVTFTATDECGNTETCVGNIFILDEIPPVMDCFSISDMTVTCSDDINNLGVPLVADNATSANEITLTFEDDNSNFIDCQNGGFIIRTFTATDRCGNTATCVQEITISDSTHPIVSCDPINEIHQCNGLAGNQFASLAWNEANLAVLSNCSSSDCDITVSSNYDFNNFSNDCGLTGSLSVVYTIEETCGNNSVNKTATFSIRDTSDPVIVCDPDNVILECTGSAGNEGNADAWDVANITKLSACATDFCSLSPEVTITSDYDFNNLSDNCGLTGALFVIYTMTDPCGNSVTKTATLTIIDTTAPDFAPECVPNDQTINCNENGVNQALVEQWNQNNLTKLVRCGIDNCGEIRVTSDFDYANLPQSCDEDKSLAVVYTIYDECDNTTTFSATLTEIIEETSSGNCERLNIQGTNNQLTISNISAPNTITKIFDSNWQLISNCSGDCPETVMLSDLTAGEIYHTDVQFYNENWAFICEAKRDVEIVGGNEPCDTSVCQGDVILRTQAEVDAFCGCAVIEGDLAIGFLGQTNGGIATPPTDILNISSLRKLKKVNGTLIVGKTQLINLNGLKNLEEVFSTFIIGANPKLENLEGLEKLRRVGSIFLVKWNHLIENLNDLKSLRSIYGLELWGDNINDISIFSNLESTTINQLDILNCERITSLNGLEQIDSIKGSATIAANDKLENIDALKGIKYVKSLTIADNPTLNNCCGVVHLIDNEIDNGTIEGDLVAVRNLQFCNSPEEILQACQTPPPTCKNIQIQTQNNQITIEGLTAPNEIVKVFDKNFNIVYQCVANCEETQMAGIFPVGAYTIDLQLYDENWELICAEQRAVTVETGNGNPCDVGGCETIAPVLANILGDMTVECDAVPSEPTNITATDNCDSDVEVRFDEVRTNGSCEDNYTLIRTWTAFDDCGNSSSKRQVITIVDSTDPILANIPPDLTFNESEGFDTTFPIPTDNCDSGPELTVEDVVNLAGTEIVRTFTATDNCGNTAIAQQIITIIPDGNNPCDSIDITASTEAITLTNITAPNSIVKVFDPNWQFIYECNATCESELTIPVESEGIHHTDIQFYDENWQFICQDRQGIEVIFEGEPCDTSVCQGDVVLRTQAEVDAFCGCAVIEGDFQLGLQISNLETNSDIYNIETLRTIKHIEGTIQILRTQLINLEGLNFLESVNSFVIDNNNQLESLKGLENLKIIGQSLNFKLNPKLINLDGLVQLNYIGSTIILSGNEQLNSIEVLKNVRNSSLGRIFILNNNALSSLEGLNNIQAIEKKLGLGILVVSQNNNLTNISALSHLVFVDSIFTVSANSNLIDCCPIAHLLDDNETNGRIDGRIFIADNNFSCNNIQTINNICDVSLSNCEAIKITKTSNRLNISNLLVPIQIVKVFDNNYATVYECFADCEETINLTDLAAGTYHININLYDENWEPICERTESIEVEEGSAQNRNNDFLPADFALYPNPAETATYLDLSKLKGEKVQLDLYNQFGQKISQQVIEKVSDQKTKIDLTSFQNGVYVLQIKGEHSRVIAKKLIVNRLY